MKVIILAGGFGTRLSEYTDVIPKPMAKIGDKPILWHIMKIFENHALNDFVLALGYKSEIIKEYFSKYSLLNSDFSIDLKNGNMHMHQVQSEDWKITLVDTGLNTMTGGRIKRLKDYVGNKTFIVTYGDGVGNINIDDLIKFHKSHNKLATVTAVRPQARFGELEIKMTMSKVLKKNHNLIRVGLMGIFVLEPEVLDFISDDSVMFEREPLEKLSSEGNLMAYKHHGF